ncbi:M20 family metallopeptidase [Aestuariimicrobium ganziense]|uniref:M20 family metallopeptidase n=1 Tax=Aestuariimicrobium ganziense TaxID=2773677 RepID=UPI00194558C8|nr:M20 family metallopeptidase [Aestuariimicrobium ganziense]
MSGGPGQRTRSAELADWSTERLVDLASRLISARSENPDLRPDPTHEADAVDQLEQEALALGFEVTRQTVVAGRDNLTIVSGADRPGAALVFLGHSDVVPAGAGWTRDPFGPVVEGGRLYGRGSTDMKGGIAAVLATMDTLARDPDFTHPVELLVTVDEEDLATGVQHHLADAEARDLLACIVAEPTDLDVIVGCRGAANLHLEVTGRAAHAGRPSDGASAIIAASQIVALLKRQHDQHADAAGGDFWTPTWNVGRIVGGHGTSIVADHCSLDVDRRLMPDEQPEQVLEDLLEAIRAEGITGDGIEVTGRLDMAMPGFLCDEDDPLPRAAITAVHAAGRPDAELQRWTAACEGGFLAQHHGVPTIVLGPGEITTQAHQPDESVAVDDLATAARAYLGLAHALADAAVAEPLLTGKDTR